MIPTSHRSTITKRNITWAKSKDKNVNVPGIFNHDNFFKSLLICDRSNTIPSNGFIVNHVSISVTSFWHSFLLFADLNPGI